METRIEVFLQKGLKDNSGEGVKNDIGDLGVKGVKRVETAQIYLLEGEISQSQKKMICENLLIDPLIQKYSINSRRRSCCEPKTKQSDAVVARYEVPWQSHKGRRCWAVEVWPKRGVTDTVAESTEKGIRDLGIKGIKQVSTGKKYLIFGSLSSEEIETISRRLLANKVIENYSITKNA